MKVETPQLRWHQIINPQTKQDAGANGPILSCSLLTINDNVGILATAGNTEVNLWKVGFTPDAARMSAKKRNNDIIDIESEPQQQQLSSHILVQPQTSNSTTSNNTINEHTQITHLVTLSRGSNERNINAVKFSPSGQHLVSAGDAGTIVMWSIPTTSSNNNDNNLQFWSTIEKETDLHMKIIFNQTEDIMDVSWSSDSKRFMVCSMDHTVVVYEKTITGSTASSSNTTTGAAAGADSNNNKMGWITVHRSSKDHTHYIQGVSYDPQGVYLASMGSDRMVKVYSRKNLKDGVIRGELAKYEEENTEEGGNKQDDKKKGILQTKVLPDLLTNTNFALQNKIKTMKFLNMDTNKNKAADKESSTDEAGGESANTPNAKRHHMFADELTLGSFFRRLAFTTDGAFLVVPAALWHGSSKNGEGKSAPPSSPTSVVSNEDKLSESSFATYLFARHHFDQPYKVLTGLEKPSVVVRPNPVLFQLPSNAANTTSTLPYRSIFAVLTADTVLIYDTHHNTPLAMARGLHYAGLTDAAWSNDGRTLFVTSSDGYVSILSFGNGELGEVYEAPQMKIVAKQMNESKAEASSATPSASGGAKQPEVAVNTLVAKKKPKASPSAAEGKKVTFSPVNEIKQIEPRQQPEPVVINTLVVRKKKKKVAPTLVTTDSLQSLPAKPSNSAEEETQVNSDASVEKKRSVEEVSAVAPPAATVPEGTVNILLPKKKKKVAGSSTPVATS